MSVAAPAPTTSPARQQTRAWAAFEAHCWQPKEDVRGPISLVELLERQPLCDRCDRVRRAMVGLGLHVAVNGLSEHVKNCCDAGGALLHEWADARYVVIEMRKRGK